MTAPKSDLDQLAELDYLDMLADIAFSSRPGEKLSRRNGELRETMAIIYRAMHRYASRNPPENYHLLSSIERSMSELEMQV